MEEQSSENRLSTNAGKLGRRSFVKGAGLTGMGLAGAAFAGAKLGLFDKVPGAKTFGMNSTAVEASTNLDVEIVNFALNLEYLEAEFYTVATTGKTIEEIGIGISGVGKCGPTTGGKRVHFEREGGDWNWREDEVSGRLRAVAEEIAYDEQQHVILLRSLLGDAAITKPTIDLDALGIGFDNFRQFLQLARAFEDTGVSAYGGAAPLLTSKTILGYAARIALTEALHSSNLRLLIAENHVKTSPLDSLDILPPPSGKQYFEVDSQALAVVRTTSQVLAIAYGNSTPGTTMGGFFPDGVNGPINTV
jgi:Ferritin-like domain